MKLENAKSTSPTAPVTSAPAESTGPGIGKGMIQMVGHGPALDRGGPEMDQFYKHTQDGAIDKSYADTPMNTEAHRGWRSMPEPIKREGGEY